MILTVTLVHAAEVGWAEIMAPEHDVRDHDVGEGDKLPNKSPLSVSSFKLDLIDLIWT